MRSRMKTSFICCQLKIATSNKRLFHFYKIGRCLENSSKRGSILDGRTSKEKIPISLSR